MKGLTIWRCCKTTGLLAAWSGCRKKTGPPHCLVLLASVSMLMASLEMDFSCLAAVAPPLDSPPSGENVKVCFMYKISFSFLTHSIVLVYLKSTIFISLSSLSLSLSPLSPRLLLDSSLWPTPLYVFIVLCHPFTGISLWRRIPYTVLNSLFWIKYIFLFHFFTDTQKSIWSLSLEQGDCGKTETWLIWLGLLDWLRR